MDNTVRMVRRSVFAFIVWRDGAQINIGNTIPEVGEHFTTLEAPGVKGNGGRWQKIIDEQGTTVVTKDPRVV